MNRATMDPRTKGLPHGTAGLDVPDIATKGWNVLAEDLPFPLALLKSSALSRNSAWMREFLSRTGAKIAPHGKTTMSPELFKRQLDDGAWAITLATVQQVRVARAAGVSRIVLANQLIGIRDIEYIVEELSGDKKFEFFCLVDSVAGVRLLDAGVKGSSLARPLNVLIEVGFFGGRAGCRDVESAEEIANAVKAAAPHLLLCGLEGFEGSYQYLPSSESVPKIRSFLETIVAIAQRLDEKSLFGSEEIILSAGGSAYYDLVIESFGRIQLSRRTSVVLRSGCYFTHDAGWYGRLYEDLLKRSKTAEQISAPLQNALEVWAYVISVPEAGRAILGAGRRDFGNDAGAPIPLSLYRKNASSVPEALPGGYEIVVVNDQHAHMTFPVTAELHVGDLIGLGVSHPCTTFDKWQLIYMVDDDYNIVSAVRTFF